MKFPRGMTADQRFQAFVNVRFARDQAAIHRENILAAGHPRCRTFVRVDENRRVHLRIEYQMNADVQFAFLKGAIHV